MLQRKLHFRITTTETTKCFISLFEGKRRLLTQQDEVTNALMDRVSGYIKESVRFQFAIEQLGLRWDEISAMDFFLWQSDVQQVRRQENTETFSGNGYDQQVFNCFFEIKV